MENPQRSDEILKAQAMANNNAPRTTITTHEFTRLSAQAAKSVKRKRALVRIQAAYDLAARRIENLERKIKHLMQDEAVQDQLIERLRIALGKQA